jgi:bifunctional non-homologous end joining protein LigD
VAAAKDSGEALVLDVAGRAVRVSNPDKVYFARAGLKKIDIVNYFIAVGEAALMGVKNRPMALKRFVNGADGDFFFQKRAPPGRPEWLKVVELHFPSGLSAEEVVIDHVAGLAWVANLGCLDLNPHAIRAENLAHPDELRIDLDPMPKVDFDQVKQVAFEVNAVLSEFNLLGFAKTSGNRGLHVNVRIAPRYDFVQVRRCALALSREVERRVPKLATTKWWKEEREGVFLDYNQNAQDKTMASAYSVRPTPDARVSTPFQWHELSALNPLDFTVATVPQRLLVVGDPGALIDNVSHSLDAVLELVARHEGEGLGDAPWPPHYAKQAGEPKRVAPSRRKKEA